MKTPERNDDADIIRRSVTACVKLEAARLAARIARKEINRARYQRRFASRAK
jgi:hypothetical protein